MSFDQASDRPGTPAGACDALCVLLNAYSTLLGPPPLDFPHTLRNRRDRSDGALADHLEGFAGFVTARGSRPMTRTRYAVLRHIQRVRHQIAVDVDDAQRR